MSGASRSDFEAALQRALDCCQAAGRTIDLWWRDDDAVAPSDALDALLDRVERQDVPLLLAVIPEPASPALFERLRPVTGMRVSQHGFAHVNHQAPPAKAAELGDARPAGAVLAELREGRIKLERQAGRQWLPILTPPWNRIDPKVAAQRGQVGLCGLSTFGPVGGDRRQVNTHFDLIAWKRGGEFIGWDKAIAIVEEELEDRRAGRDEPFGLLTHHLVHTPQVWQAVDSILAVAGGHKAARWRPIEDLFGLDRR